MGDEPKSKGWWQTLPGILTAIAAIITAVTGLIVALHQAGIFEKPAQTVQVSPPKVALEKPQPTTVQPKVTEDKPKATVQPKGEEYKPEHQAKPTVATTAAPDLFVSEFSLNPSTPIQRSPVSVRVGVYNKGRAPSGPFTVQWWAGERYPSPACSWRLDGLAAKGGRILNCTYDGYPSWYAKLVTKSVVDSSGEVSESDESNNVHKQTIRVSKP